MSNIYIQEPPTNGKVLLNTSVGDIDIELWSKEAPKACRNFVQLCLEGYYDNTIFHRIVKGFCIQGGDPTGRGTGGESIYGQPFKDEIHQRLRFVRRGLVAMANAGKNDNQSQFFFTLGRADELNGKHTIFGKVTGNTIYNMLEMESLEVDSNDRPVYPPTFYSSEVLSNPFEDIIPRKKNESHEDEKEDQKAKKAKGTKNFSLLSFGEEAEEDEDEVGTFTKEMKIKSSHDVLNDPKLSSVPAVEPLSSDSMERNEDQKRIANDVRSKLKRTGAEIEESSTDTTDTRDEVSDRKTELRKESRRLQRELRGEKKKSEAEHVAEEMEDEEVKEVSAVKEFRQERKEYLHKKNEQIKKKGSGREEQTMQLLLSFQTKLENTDDGGLEMKVSDDDNEEDEDADDGSWLHHKLVFEDQQRTVKDANIHNEDTYEIFDPRNPINKRRREESKRRQQEKKRK